MIISIWGLLKKVICGDNRKLSGIIKHAFEFFFKSKTAFSEGTTFQVLMQQTKSTQKNKQTRETKSCFSGKITINL